MRVKAEFGHMGPTEKRNPNTGRPIQDFITDVKLWCGEYSLSLSERMQYHGMDESIAMVIFVRHNSKVNETQKVRVNGQLYDIRAITQDNGIIQDGYDLISLRKVTSNG